MLQLIDQYINRKLSSFVIKKDDPKVDSIDAKLKAIDESLEAIDWDDYEDYLRHKENGRIIYEGGCTGFRLKKEDRVAVQEAHMKKGDVFEWHNHESREVIVVYEGKIKNVTNGEEVIGVGGYIVVNPSDSHKVVALEDTSMICIVVPKEKGYP